MHSVPGRPIRCLSLATLLLGLAATAARAQTSETAAPAPVPALPSTGAAVPSATLGITDPGGLSLGGGAGLAGTRFGLGTVTTGGLTDPGGLSFGGGASGASIGASAIGSGQDTTPGAVTGSIGGASIGTRSGVLDPRPDAPGIGTSGAGGAPAGAGIGGAPSRADEFFDPFAGRGMP